MKIKLFRNTSDNRTLAKNLEMLDEIDGVYLKSPCDIINPVFVISGNRAESNYLWCDEFSRYYFVDDVVFLNGNRCELHCSVDVLMTYKSSILNTTAVIDRANENFNVSLVDDIKRTTVISDTVNKNFSAGEFTAGLTALSRCIVLTCYGGV